MPQDHRDAIQFQWSRLEELTALQVHTIIMAREAVFVVEQQCAYQEADSLDRVSWHLLGMIGDDLAAYVRLVDPGKKFEQPSIGRVMTAKPFRGSRLGRPLMEEAIAFCEKTFPGQGIRIGAQVYLKSFYQSLGFSRVGDEYDEDGIPHVDMVLTRKR